MNYTIPISQQVNEIKSAKFPFKIKFVIVPKPNQRIGLTTLYPIQVEIDNFLTSKKRDTSKVKKIASNDVLNVVRLVTKEKTNPYGGKTMKSWLETDDGFALDNSLFRFSYFVPEEKVVEKKSPATNLKSEEKINQSDLGKKAKKVQLGFLLVGWGIFGVLAYKFWNKSTTWKLILTIYGAYNLYNTYKLFRKPAIKVSDSSEKVETSTSQPLSTDMQSSANKLYSDDTSLMNKFQKIDLILQNMKNQEGADNSPEGVQNTKAYLNTLSDSELNTWIKLSRALSDSEINSAMQTNQQKGFQLLQSKYGLSQTQVETSLKKLMDFLSSSINQALKKPNFVGENTMFSDFEGDLDLDI